MTNFKSYSIAIHGGAGTFTPSKMSTWKKTAYEESLRRALEKGVYILSKGGKAIDAVIASVELMENTSFFNAGKGSVFTNKEKNEMDAALMDGKSLKAGSVSGIQFVKNPIRLAEKIMKNSKHVMLGGSQALEFAKMNNLEIMPEAYFYDEYRLKQLKRAKEKDQVTLDHDSDKSDEKFGTVGAVALDRKGNLAAATSTGGMVNKRYGRVGDSPIIGAGTYANNETCAISCTGHGEYFIRYVVAHEVSSLMKYAGFSLEDASNLVINKILKDAKGRGGLIGVDYKGNIVLKFNTKGMYRASKKEGQNAIVGIF